ncbi:neuromedin-S isoform X1 [Geospiza fortis]|uniref:Neuromedin-S isoform X1 n=1 Tax=Geospiza fortis TaxID=48883 RepID=A0A8N5EJF3_GEOFO|nr:neuromedin-S isoform X1 [Geospiza fortis]
MRRAEVGKRRGRWETRLCGREMSNWPCVSVSGWKCPINPRSPALFWISAIPYSTACIKMRNHRLLLQSLQRSLEMEELLKAMVSRQPKVSRISSAISPVMTLMRKEDTTHYKPSTNLDTHFTWPLRAVLTEM